MDRRQRLEHLARGGAEADSGLAHSWVDADGAPGYARGYRQRGGALLLRGRRLDHGTGHLRRWWRVTDEPGDPVRDPARVAGPLLRRDCGLTSRPALAAAARGRKGL